MKITMEDMRRVNFCATGVQAFFMRHQLDFEDFLRDGISAETLLDTGSVFARRCVACAKQARQGEV